MTSQQQKVTITNYLYLSLTRPDGNKFHSFILFYNLNNNSKQNNKIPLDFSYASLNTWTDLKKILNNIIMTCYSSQPVNRVAKIQYT